MMPLLKTLVLAYTAAGVNAFTTFPSQEGGAALPERMTYGGTSAKPLDNIGGTAYDLAECQGDCDNDDDCQTGLECFQRGGYEAVPGCSGQGKKGWDYCYETEEEIELSGYGTNDGSAKNLRSCIGECDGDWQCA